MFDVRRRIEDVRNTPSNFLAIVAVLLFAGSLAADFSRTGSARHRIRRRCEPGRCRLFGSRYSPASRAPWRAAVGEDTAPAAQVVAPGRTWYGEQIRGLGRSYAAR